MKPTIRIAIFLYALLPWMAANAAHVTLSGRFDGSEPVLPAFPGTCAGAGMLQYEQFQPVQVSASGTYSVSDPSNNLPGDIVVAVYSGAFDPGDATANRIATIDEGDALTLNAGQEYVIVVQSWCSNASPVVYAVAIAGPGAVSGEDVVTSPSYTLGDLSAADPQAEFGGLTVRYDLLGPVQVADSGLYWFADVSVYDRLDMQLLVYESAFDPSDTSANLVAGADDSGSFVLQTGKDYYFVVIPFFQGQTGPWHWVLFPPGPLQFNAGLNGAWFNAATPGQGVLLDIFTELRLVFLAWFTFDLEAADGSVVPMIGGSGQRWLTAIGSYSEGDIRIDMNIENTTGGAFDSPQPAVEQDSDYGTVELEFSDCLNATLTYDIPGGGVAGVIPMTRIANDHLALCATLGSTGPGVITAQ